MKIDNFSEQLLANLICPVSRESLSISGDHLRSESGYAYPDGDFRTVSSLTQNPEWTKGQMHYEKYNSYWMSQSEEFYRSVDAETADLYRTLPLKGKVLDVGGGYGTVTLQAALNPGDIICVDPMVCCWADVPESAFKTHYARLGSVVRIPGFAEDLPFRNSGFDTVHMRSCLDHFANPHRALLEARRVLSKDGSLVIGLALEGAFKLRQSGLKNLVKRKIKDSFIGDVYEYLFDPHMFHPTEMSLKSLLTSAGFKIEHWVHQAGYHNVVYVNAKKSI